MIFVKINGELWPHSFEDMNAAQQFIADRMKLDYDDNGRPIYVNYECVPEDEPL